MASIWNPGTLLSADYVHATALAGTDGEQGAKLVGYKLPGGAARTVAARLGDRVSAFDFMSAEEIADVKAGTKTLNVTAAVLAAIAYSKDVYFPAGVYRLSPVVLEGIRGLKLQGAGASLLAGGLRYLNNTVLSFDDAPIGTNGIQISDFVGLTISDLVISMRRGAGANGSGGGIGLYCYGGHDYALINVKVDVRVGGGGGGVILGGGDGATSTFIGSLRNVKVFSHTSVAIKLNFGTSVHLSSCYQVGGWFEFFGMAYCSVDACASELAPNYYGYMITGCSGITFNGCGAEGNARGAFYLSNTSSNIVINSPYGAANNTLGDTTIGDLVHIDSSAGVVRNITITNPTSVSPNVLTSASIYASAGTGRVEVLGEDAVLLPKGIGGNATWLTTKLSRRGDRENQSWTPVLVAWTSTGTAPTATGGWIKQGDLVFFWVRIVPGTNMSAVRPSSTITGLPFSPIAASAAQLDDNGVSYGGVTIGSGGIIYPQSLTNLTVPLTISGTFQIS